MKPLEELLEIAKSAKERADNAHEHICKLAKDGAKSWRLSIPVQDDDSDVLLQAPLDLVPQLSDAVIDLITQLKDARVENADLKKRNGWLESGFIHTCHDECQRHACVMRREITSLKAEIEILNLKYINGMIDHPTYKLSKDLESENATLEEQLTIATEALEEYSRGCAIRIKSEKWHLYDQDYATYSPQWYQRSMSDYDDRIVAREALNNINNLQI